MLKVRGFDAIKKLLSKNGKTGQVAKAIMPSAPGSLGRLYTQEAKALLKHSPRFGQLTPETVVQMAGGAEAAKVHLALFQEANKHYATLAQAATQAHATQLQLQNTVVRADEAFQRTYKQAAEIGFKHGLRGSTQDIQMNAWQAKKQGAKAALYG